MAITQIISNAHFYAACSIICIIKYNTEYHQENTALKQSVPAHKVAQNLLENETAKEVAINWMVSQLLNMGVGIKI
jgi:hypothetical protein